MKKNFKFIFNDRAFDDGWAEPYVVSIKTYTKTDTDKLSALIEASIRRISEDGIQCSDEGIKEVMEDLKDIIAEYRIFQLDGDFEYGGGREYEIS